MQMRDANWSYPTSIRFGPGRISELAQACAAAGISRPLFVTDPGLADLPITKDALGVLQTAAIDTVVFSDIQPNPVDANLEAGLVAYRQGGHDGVVAFGGGSGLDMGKLIAFMAGQTRPVWDFEDIGEYWRRADGDAVAPIVAVPTTAGTGSEVGRAGVVTNLETRTKKVIFHPKMLPREVIADPELTLGLPPVITAGTGMDALAHNLEAFCAPTYHPMSRGIAVEGMRLVHQYLNKAVADGSDIEARGQMMSAAMMGAVAFQKGLGAVHSLSHPVGSLYGTHHGLTNAVFLPYVLIVNKPAIETDFDCLAGYLGLQNQSFDGVFDWILELRAAVGIPHTLAELGVNDDQAGLIADMAIVDPTASGNPVQLTREVALGIFTAALSGRLER
jgi:alcohol dehydrogenase class IV